MIKIPVSSKPIFHKVTNAVASLIVGGILCAQTPATQFQLADPVVAVDSILFREMATLRARLDYPGVVLRYTRDGNVPTAAAKRMPEVLRVGESGTLRIRAFHPELQPSAVVAVPLVRVGEPVSIASARFSAPPHADYPGGGAASLFDLQKGGSNFRQPAWTGFSGADATIELTLAEPQVLDSVVVSTLSNLGAWIFPPSGISVYGGTEPDELTLLGEQAFAPLTKAESAAPQFRSVRCAARPVTQLRIVVHNAGAIPEWHMGAGTPAWLFLDEIVLSR